MPDYTQEQIAAAIAEPRVGDVWEKGGKLRTITKIVPSSYTAATDIQYSCNGKRSAIFQINFARWAKTATLLIRTGAPS